jgi:multiple sugar transport system permease protein
MRGTGIERGTVGEVLALAPDRALSWERRQRRVYAGYAGPALALLFAVTIVPTLFLVGTSLTNLNPSRPGTLQFIGLDNYTLLLQQDRFWNSIWVQVRLSFWTVSLQLLIGLAFALLLNSRLRFLELARSFFIIPMVLPPVIVAIIWKILFTPNISPINWALSLVGVPAPAWLVHPFWALVAIVVAETWEWFPFTMLMLLAALQMMPDEPLEAARIDGASAPQVFWHIVLPLLKPAILVAVLFRLIDSVKAFPHIFIMTGGGPGVATEPTNFYAYLQGFTFSLIGFSSSISTVILVLTMGLSFVIIRMVGRQVDVE